MKKSTLAQQLSDLLAPALLQQQVSNSRVLGQQTAKLILEVMLSNQYEREAKKIITDFIGTFALGMREALEPTLGEIDALFPQAVAIVKTAGKVSAGLLQSKLRIGYAAAARLIDQMESRGIISSAEGNQPRTVL